MESVSSPAADEAAGAFEWFLREFRVAGLLRRCGCRREGVPALTLFTYALCNVLRGASVWMQLRAGSFPEGFSKNTFYRFLADARVDWLRFVMLLSVRVAARLGDGDGCLVVDDTLYERAGARAELESRVHDHARGRHARGYRMMTLGWTDGGMFLPVGFCLLASSDDGKVLRAASPCDGRTLAGRRRAMARRKGTDVMVELVRMALSAGLGARRVLFDSWFANPSQLAQLKGLGVDSIGMVKAGAATRYECQGRRLTAAQIYQSRRKRRGRARWKLSVPVRVAGPEGHAVDARLIYVPNTSGTGRLTAIITTDMGLPEDDAVDLYGRRWGIEVFFKDCKSRLGLTSECHCLSYDAITAHAAIVLTRYTALAAARRERGDKDTIGELLQQARDDMAAGGLRRAARTAVDAATETIRTTFHTTARQTRLAATAITRKLPPSLRPPSKDSKHKTTPSKPRKTAQHQPQPTKTQWED